MKPSFLFAVISTVFVTACTETTTSTIPQEVPALTAAISGKTIAAGGATFNIGRDGSMVGTAPNGDKVLGAWTERNGQFCRTISEPARIAGTECQDAELGDGTIAITSSRGTTIWTIS